MQASLLGVKLKAEFFFFSESCVGCYIMSEVVGSTTEQLVVDWVQEDVGLTAEAPLLMADPSLGSPQCKTGESRHDISPYT